MRAASAIALVLLGACTTRFGSDLADADAAGAARTDAEHGGGDGDDGGTAGVGRDGGGGSPPLRSHVSSALAHLGVAVAAGRLGDPGYAALVGGAFDLVTPEDALKWGSVEPRRGAPDYADADAIIAFAEAHAQVIRGHTLVWHLQLPAWVEGLAPADLRAALDAHIDRTVGRYRGRVAIWDVVNEALDDAGGLRDSVFLRALGPGYVADAFRRAHAADPAALLAYNDYGLEGDGPKTDAAVALLAGLLADGVPVHVVGLQAHLTAYELAIGDTTETELRHAIQRFGALGLRVHLTELDLRVAALPVEPAARLAYQAAAYQRVVAICRDEPACDVVSFWGATDRDSWLDRGATDEDPLPWDDAGAPKPAVDAIRRALDGDAGPGFTFAIDAACPATAAWCAPFESLGLPGDFARDFTLVSSGGVVETTTTRAHRGARALRAVTPGGSPGAQALVGRWALAGARTGAVHLRTWVYVPSSSSGTLSFASVTEGAPPYAGVGAGIVDGELQLSLTTAGSYPIARGVRLARDTWHCVELAIDVADAGGAASLSVDGARVLAVSGTDTAPAGGLANAVVGVLYVAPTATAAEVFIDDAAIGRDRLGCD